MGRRGSFSYSMLPLPKTNKGRLEELFLGGSTLCRVSKLLLNLCVRLEADFCNKVFEVGLIVSLNGGKHVLGTRVK